MLQVVPCVRVGIAMEQDVTHGSVWMVCARYGCDFVDDGCGRNVMCCKRVAEIVLVSLCHVPSGRCGGKAHVMVVFSDVVGSLCMCVVASLIDLCEWRTFRKVAGQ